MSEPLVPDDRWDTITPLVPPEPPTPTGGRPTAPACRTGIVVGLRTGVSWEDLPQELGCGSGMPGWRRRRAWPAAGVWEQLHRALLDRLGEADQVDGERACRDSARIPAQRGAIRPDRTRRTAANRARRALGFPTAAAPRSPRS